MREERDGEPPSGQLRSRRGTGRLIRERTLFESRSLMTLVFLNEGYLEKASVRTFSVQSFDTSETNSRNHLGSHSVNDGLRGKGRS